MRRKPRKGAKCEDIISVTITDNQTWNDCPSCGLNWQDIVPTPGVIHRTRYCDDCNLKKQSNPIYRRIRKNQKFFRKIKEK